MTNTIKTIQNAINEKRATLSKAAINILEQVLEDAADPVGDNSELTVRDLLNALEDGEYLSKCGIQNQQDVEEAYSFLEGLE